MSQLGNNEIPLPETGNVVSEPDLQGLVPIESDEKLDLLNEQSQDTDELLTIASTMEELNIALDNISSSGVISEPAACAISTALEHLIKRSGVDYANAFSLESFQGTASRRKALNAAIENISDTIANIIRRIISWIKAVFEYIYDDIEHAVRGADAVARRAKRVQEEAIRLQGVGSSEQRKTTIKRRSITSFFNDNGAPMSFSEIADKYRNYNKEMNEGFSSNTLQNAVAHVANAVQQTVRRIGVKDFTNEEALIASNAGIIYLKENTFKNFKPAPETNGNETLSYELPFGNSEIHAVLGKLDNTYNTVSTSVVQNDVLSIKEIPALTPAEVIEFTKAIESDMHRGIYRDHLKIKAQLKDVGKIVTNTCDAITKAQAQVGSGNIPSLHFLKTLTSTLLGLTKSVYKYSGLTNRTLLYYCEDSLRAWA